MKYVLSTDKPVHLMIRLYKALNIRATVKLTVNYNTCFYGRIEHYNMCRLFYLFCLLVINGGSACFIQVHSNILLVSFQNPYSL